MLIAHKLHLHNKRDLFSPSVGEILYRDSEFTKPIHSKIDATGILNERKRQVSKESASQAIYHI